MTVLHVWESLPRWFVVKIEGKYIKQFLNYICISNCGCLSRGARRALLVEQFSAGLEEAVGVYPRGSNNYKQQLHVNRS